MPSGTQSTSPAFIASLGRRGGDEGQWYDFVSRYGELILSIARHHGLQPADCEDVLQDSLIELTRSMRRGFEYDRSRGRFRDYLRRIVLRVTYRRIRQKYATGPQQDCVEAPARCDGAPGGCGEEVWELQWRRYHVRQALRVIEAEFSEVNRTAFMMCTARGQSPAAVAEWLGISIDQVYQARSRIFRRLLDLIERQVAEEG